jgi:trk system potassium uptake protein TrkH
VTSSWILIGIIGALPYIFSGAIPSFIDAFFESVSGFTTTGASILTDIEVLPKSILFWRSLTHWIGGIGIIVLVILIMPSMKMGGYHMFSLESSFHEKIKPRIRAVGYRLLWIYVGLTFLETLLLLAGGMNLFESLCHSFGTVATGGFSPKNSSIIDYSPYIQYVIMIFMLLAGTNFLVYYYALKGEFFKVRSNDEVKFYFSVVISIGLILTGVLFFRMDKPLELSFREAFFQIISIISCTGFASADYLLWPQYGWVLIFFAMFLGGCTGSTAGGIKMARHVILIKNIRNILIKSRSPNAVVTLKLNKNLISPETNNTILTFITLYIMIFFAGTFLMSLMGIDIKTASSSVATCMAGIGPGIGTVGPVSNFAHLPDAAKVLLPLLMIIGRLEIFTIIVLFSRSFWKS